MGDPIPVNKHDVRFTVTALLRDAGTTKGDYVVNALVEDPRNEVIDEFERHVEKLQAILANARLGREQRLQSAERSDETDRPTSAPDLNAIRDAAKVLSDQTGPSRFSVRRIETFFNGLTVEDARELGLAD